MQTCPHPKRDQTSESLCQPAAVAAAAAAAASGQQAGGRGGPATLRRSLHALHDIHSTQRQRPGAAGDCGERAFLQHLAGRFITLGITRRCTAAAHGLAPMRRQPARPRTCVWSCPVALPLPASASAHNATTA